jgi:glycosyltransferase involved in cell wall biosynthesis
MRGHRFVRRVARGSAPQVSGAIERAQAGLVSGWLACPECPTTPTVGVAVDGTDVKGRLTSTPRPDVPGGEGFLLRFATATNKPRKPTRVHIECREHPDVRIDTEVATEAWDVPALGQVEHLAWPHASGWIAEFAPADPGQPLRLVIDGFPAVPVQPNIARSDVQAFLGDEGVAGFQADMGDLLGYAVPEGSVIRLCRGARTLHEVTLAASPIGDGAHSCLPRPSDAIGPQATPADDARIAGLLRRFRETPISATAQGDWLHLLEAIGIQVHTASTRQWAEYLAAQGLADDVIAGQLALRAVQGLRVPVLDPLPEDLHRATRGATLPARARAWREGILGLDVTAAHAPSAPEPQNGDDGRLVCVAGLVQHKSGLGQNANHSLTALAAAGIHAYAEPFFPAPGGWNPRLAPTEEAMTALRDHDVLLHLPIDRVVQSLAAQPALLASPRIIGYFMWETAVVPRQLHRPLSLVDEIWTATEFVANGYRAVTDTPVRVTGHAVDVDLVERVTKSEFGITEDAFVVHFSFDANSTVARKNPNAAIDAFRRAFEGDPSAAFVLKVRNMQQAEHLARQGDPDARGLMTRLRDDPRIRLVTGELSHGRSLGLIAMADCFISLHRSEGFGYAVGEAMALGTPVVATDYSGSTDFLSEREGWPVAYELTDVLPEEYFYWEPGMQWAEAQVEDAARALREVRNGNDVEERVSRAAARILAVASMDSLRDSYAMALRGQDG